MKQFAGFCFIFLLLASAVAAQDISTLLEQLKEEKDPAKLADINNLLAEKYLTKDGEKTILYAKAAIKYATISKNNTVKAEALSFQAKATAGLYAPNKIVPNRRNQSARFYYDAKSLFDKSISLSKSIGYTQLELDNLENLAYLNTKSIGRHEADKREEVKYYKLYITRIKEIKKVTKPKANYTVTDSGGNNNSSNNNNSSKPQSSDSDKFVKQLVAEKYELKSKVKNLELEVSFLEKELEHLNTSLKKALDSGTSSAEIERLKKEQEKIEKELKERKK